MSKNGDDIKDARVSTRSSSFIVTVNNSFQVYQTDPLKRKFLKEFVSYRVGKVAIVDDGTIVAFSAIPMSPELSTEKVFIWNNQFGEAQSQLDFKGHVTGLLIADHFLMIILTNSTVVYDIEKAKIQYEIVTTENPAGVGDLLVFDAPMVAVCGLQPGAINVGKAEDQANSVVFTAHQHALSLIKFSPDGSMIATSSEKGTLIRVFNTETGVCVGAFRRGTVPSKILTLAFSPDNVFLVAISENGTAHLFSRDSMGDEKDPARAVSKLKIGKSCQADCVFKNNEELLVVTSNGYLNGYTCEGGSLRSIQKSFILSH